MLADDIIKDAQQRMEKAVNHLREELRTIRTGRASPALVDTIKVNYYGTPTPLKQLAAISTPDPQQILIRPFDANICKDIVSAIQQSDLGLTPQSDGKVVRLNIPPMSGEQRQKLAQRVKKLCEDAKIAIRNIRRDANKRIEQEVKNKTMSEDDEERAKKKIQNLTDEEEKKAQELADKKIAEIME
ncbi:MAG: ribosome recycling factor [Gemmatales bacterium]|nr:ribosome recycling factor [Gemmatales bacterium]MDW7993873.1 ribosome recycling factor [Gemmatales bacterium]